ncbi:hypothetical protein U1Q18_008644 [Sarracenia purpurea var. burkii]
MREREREREREHGTVKVGGELIGNFDTAFASEGRSETVVETRDGSSNRRDALANGLAVSFCLSLAIESLNPVAAGLARRPTFPEVVDAWAEVRQHRPACYDRLRSGYYYYCTHHHPHNNHRPHHFHHLS